MNTSHYRMTLSYYLLLSADLCFSGVGSQSIYHNFFQPLSQVQQQLQSQHEEQYTQEKELCV